ncbi:MAG: glycine betaine ABC transporter substrate-binding protein [Acholeplasmataceae bacterium]
MKVKFLSKLTSLFLLTLGLFMLASCQAGEEETTVILGEASWASSIFHNRVAGYILEHGFGATVETQPTETAVMIATLPNGDIDVSLELWSDNVPTYPDDIAAGNYVEVSTNYDDNTQGLYVPGYLQDNYADYGLSEPIEDIQDLLKPEVIALFEDPNDDSKGVIYGGPSSWSASAFLNLKMEAYGFDTEYNFEMINSSAALAAQIAGAFEAEDPIVSYYWEPTSLMGLYDLRLLSDTPYSAEDYAVGRGAFPTVNVNVVTRPGFADDMPEINTFFSNYVTSSALTNSALGYMEENDATPEQAAIWFLQQNDAWLQDVLADNPGVYELVKAALDAE